MDRGTHLHNDGNIHTPFRSFYHSNGVSIVYFVPANKTTSYVYIHAPQVTPKNFQRLLFQWCFQIIKFVRNLVLNQLLLVWPLSLALKVSSGLPAPITLSLRVGWTNILPVGWGHSCVVRLGRCVHHRYITCAHWILSKLFTMFSIQAHHFTLSWKKFWAMKMHIYSLFSVFTFDLIGKSVLLDRRWRKGGQLR